MIVGRGMGRAKGVAVSGGFIVSMGMGKIIQSLISTLRMRSVTKAKDLDQSSIVEGRRR